MPQIVKRDDVETLPVESVPVIHPDSGFHPNDEEREEASLLGLFAQDRRSSAPC